MEREGGEKGLETETGKGKKGEVERERKNRRV